jgi:hypothetical protein
MKKSELKDYLRKTKRVKTDLFYIDLFFLVIAIVLLFVIPYNEFILIPLIGVLMHVYYVYKYRSRVRIYNLYQEKEKKKIRYSFISNHIILIFTLLCISIRLFYDNNFISFNDIWVIVLPTGLVISGVNYLVNRSFRLKTLEDLQSILGMISVSFLMSYCFVVFLNSYISSAPPTIYATVIDEKMESKVGKSYDYHFKVSQDIPVDLPKRYLVPPNLYKVKKEGDSIFIEVSKGAFGIPYYTTNAIR